MVLSPRRDKPFVVINCGALPEPLLESELFGYMQGAFTDAKKDKPGRFAQAEGGSLFLDEIGDLSAGMQVKLLRVLQEKEFQPLGATSPQKADVRVITATHRSLSRMMELGTFREDLYYRLNVMKILIPPLRQRREDIPLLVDHFIHRLNIRHGKRILGIQPEAMDLFMRYNFPGNVRELQNFLEHAFILCHGTEIQGAHLPADFLQTLEREGAQEAPSIPLLQKTEAQLIIESLHRNKGHRGKTAQELGIDKSTLWRKMKRLGIQG